MTMPGMENVFLFINKSTDVSHESNEVMTTEKGFMYIIISRYCNLQQQCRAYSISEPLSLESNPAICRC